MDTETLLERLNNGDEDACDLLLAKTEETRDKPEFIGGKLKTALELYEERESVYLTRGSNQYRETRGSNQYQESLGINALIIGLLLIANVAAIWKGVTGHGDDVVFALALVSPMIVFGILLGGYARALEMDSRR